MLENLIVSTQICQNTFKKQTNLNIKGSGEKCKVVPL